MSLSMIKIGDRRVNGIKIIDADGYLRVPYAVFKGSTQVYPAGYGVAFTGGPSFWMRSTQGWNVNSSQSKVANVMYGGDYTAPNMDAYSLVYSDLSGGSYPFDASWESGNGGGKYLIWRNNGASAATFILTVTGATGQYGGYTDYSLVTYAGLGIHFLTRPSGGSWSSYIDLATPMRPSTADGFYTASASVVIPAGGAACFAISNSTSAQPLLHSFHFSCVPAAIM